MAVDALDVRMARLEGAYAQINERLAGLENRLVTEMGALRAEFRADHAELRREQPGVLQARVVRAVDIADAALAEFRDDLIGAEASPGSDGHGWT